MSNQERLDTIGRQLEDRTTHVTILTKEHYNELMCRPEAEHQMSPLEHGRSHQNAPPSLGEARDFLYDNLLHPIMGNPFAVPMAMGAKDFYGSVWRPASQMHGLFGTHIREVVVNGRHYVYIKGRQAQRTILRGTRYLADNSRIIELGIGQKGLVSEAIGGLKVFTGISVGTEVLEYLFNDEYTLVDMLGGIGVELAKMAIGTVIATAFGALVAGAFTFALLPTATMIVVGAVASVGLNMLDNDFEIKKKVQAGLKAGLTWLSENTAAFGEWTEEQYSNLSAHIDEAVSTFRQSLDDQVDASDEHIGEIVSRQIEHPYATNPYEVRGAAMQNTLLHFTRWFMEKID